MFRQVNGACFCGQVNFHVEELSGAVHTCHCDTCRQLGGGPVFRNHSILQEKVTSNDWDKITVFESSERGERGFCSNCGTHLFYRSKTKPTISLNIELFKEVVPHVAFEAELFYSSKPDYYSFENDTEKLERE